MVIRNRGITVDAGRCDENSTCLVSARSPKPFNYSSPGLLPDSTRSNWGVMYGGLYVGLHFIRIRTQYCMYVRMSVY